METEHLSWLRKQGIAAYGIDITETSWLTPSLVNQVAGEMDPSWFRERVAWDTHDLADTFQVTTSSLVLEHIPQDFVDAT